MGGPSSDLTTSDREEADDFVQCQLLLSTAITAYFDVDRSNCRTLFRDDFLGVALFAARRGWIMQALCRRLTSRAQWMLIDLGRAPRWSDYKDHSDRGLLVTAQPLASNLALDPDRDAVLEELSYTTVWDLPRPSDPADQRADAV